MSRKSRRPTEQNLRCEVTSERSSCSPQGLQSSQSILPRHQTVVSSRHIRHQRVQDRQQPVETQRPSSSSSSSSSSSTVRCSGQVAGETNWSSNPNSTCFDLLHNKSYSELDLFLIFCVFVAQPVVVMLLICCTTCGTVCCATYSTPCCTTNPQQIE